MRDTGAGAAAEALHLAVLFALIASNRGFQLKRPCLGTVSAEFNKTKLSAVSLYPLLSLSLPAPAQTPSTPQLLHVEPPSCHVLSAHL